MTATHRHLAIAFLLPILCLVPFLNKPFHLDDTFYLFVAEQILNDPFDFYGFEISWGLLRLPAYQSNMNPPGVSYMIAAVVALFGWNEIVLHAFMALLAGTLSVGVYIIARRLTSLPLIATFLAVLTPAFLVSSNLVMSDVPMLTFYVWAIALWMKGLDENRRALLVASGVLIGISALTKYFGMTAVPLLAAYTIAKQRRVATPLLYLAIPVAMLAAYQWYTWRLYGMNLVTSAADFAVDRSWSHARLPGWAKPITGLSFLGACTASIIFFVPRLWGWRRAAVFAATWLLVFVAILILHRVDRYPGRPPVNNVVLYAIQYALMIAAGAHVLLLLALDLWRSRDANALLLACWLAGTLIFSIFVNWTINVRTVLPLVPAAAIIAARHLQSSSYASSSSSSKTATLALPLALAAALSFCVLWADYRHAASAKAAAEKFIADQAAYEHTYYFKGHWGFQYYMERGGVEPFRAQHLALGSGDRVVVPVNNDVYGTFNPAVARAFRELSLTLPASRWIVTNNSRARAGFYLHFYGELPYVFGPAPIEEYAVYEIDDYEGRAARGEQVPLQYLELPEGSAPPP